MLAQALWLFGFCTSWTVETLVDTGRRSPTTNPSNPGLWLNPTWAYVEDSNCTTKNPTVDGTYDCYYGGYDFSDVPDNAVISEFWIGAHALRNVVNSPANFNFVFGFATIGGDGWAIIFIPSCTGAVDRENNIWPTLTALGFTTADLKNGNFQTFIRLIRVTSGIAGCDVLWIRVVYSVPAPPSIPKGIPWYHYFHGHETLALQTATGLQEHSLYSVVCFPQHFISVFLMQLLSFLRIFPCSFSHSVKP